MNIHQSASNEFLLRLLYFYEQEPMEAAYYIGLAKEGDFYQSGQEIVFESMKKIIESGKSPSIPEIYENIPELARHVFTDLLGSYNNTILPGLWQSLSLMRKHNIAMRLKKLHSEYEIGTAREKLSGMINELERIENLVPMETSSAKYLMKALEEQDRPKGIQTGFDCLDKNTKGLRTHHFWLIGGYSKTGKSQFALQILDRCLTKKAKVCFISLEMSGEDIMGRLLKYRTHKDGSDSKAANTLVSNDFTLITNLQKAGEIEHYLREHSFDVVFIDYLQLIDSGNNESVYENTRRNSNFLKRICQTKDVCIVALSQVSEDFMKTKKFHTGGYKGAGELASDCDVGIVLYRDFDDENANNYPSGIVPFHVILRFNRHGEQGMFQLNYDISTGIIL